MIDREKVIKALACCVFPVSKGFPYQSHIADQGCEVVECPYKGDCDQMLLDALEPRLITLEEVKNHNNKDNCVWFELRDIVVIPVFARQDRQETVIENPCILSDQTIPHLYWKNIDYCKKWRCWSSRPTDEQREAVKWE